MGEAAPAGGGGGAPAPALALARVGTAVGPPPSGGAPGGGLPGAAVGLACVAAGAAAGVAVAKQLRGAAAGWWKEEISSAGRGEGEDAPEVPLAVKVGGLLSSNSEELRSASAELRRAIRDSRTRIREMESRLQSSRTELQAARGDTRALEAQLDDLRGIAEERARALQAAEESFRKKEAELAQGLNEKSGELDLMKAVVEDLRSTVREEQKLRGEAERALAEEARLRDEATQKMEAMNKMIEDMERKAAEKARLLEAQQERFDKLSAELKALVAKAEAELADEALGRQKAEGELSEIRAAKQEIDRQMEELQSQSNKAKSEAEELQGGLAESQKAAVAKAREQEQQLQKLRAELEAALKASDGKTQEFATLESRLSAAQEESSQREGRLKAMEEEVQQAKAEADSKEEELGGLKAEVVRLEEGIAAVQAAAAEEEKKMVQELQRLGRVVESEVKGSLRPARGGGATSDGMAEQEARVVKLEQDLRDAEAQASRKEDEIQDLQQSLQALEVSLQEAQASSSGRSALESEIEAARALEAELEDRLARQQVELDEAHEQCAALDRSVESALVEEREQQLQEMEAKLQAQAALVQEAQDEAKAKEAEARALAQNLENAQAAAADEAEAMARKIDALEGELQDVQELRALEEKMSNMRDELDLAESGLDDVELADAEAVEAVDEAPIEPLAKSDALAEAADAARSLKAREAAAPLFLSLGAFDIPHPDKGAGEDAFLLMPELSAFAVADGVSGWAEDGVDPAIYPKEIMNGVEMGFSSPDVADAGLPGVLDFAYSSNEEVGSCTVCVAKLDGDNRSLKVANLGDSGLKVLRETLQGGGWQIIWQSGTQQHEFNMPYQMSSDKEYSDTARDAEYSDVPVKAGDLIVQATDGLWDNVREEDMCQTIEATVQQSGGADAVALAEALCTVASRNASDEEYPSPFMEEAVRSGQIQVSFLEKMQGIEPAGGKLDDITVVVAEVTGPVV